MAITARTVRLESDRRVRRFWVHAGDEIRSLRLDAGVTLTELAAVTDIDRSHLRRIEAGAASASVEALVTIGVALGADLSARYFAGSGPRLVDRFQAPMMEGFLGQLHARWLSRPEIRVATPVRGVVDLTLIDRLAALAVASEFQSEFRRLELQIRRNSDKADGLAARLAEEPGTHSMTVSRLLVVRSTTNTREVARHYEATLAAAYPAKVHDVLSALTTASAPWPGPGLVWMRLEGGTAQLLDGPPRGVRLGR